MHVKTPPTAGGLARGRRDSQRLMQEGTSGTGEGSRHASGFDPSLFRLRNQSDVSGDLRMNWLVVRVSNLDSSFLGDVKSNIRKCIKAT